jgi:hypothetical protein
MDGQRFDRFTKRLVARSSRRRAMTAAVGVLGAALGLGDLGAAAAATCKRPQERCRRRSQCCRSKKFRCGFSHGGGSAVRTCCGGLGAPCPGNALGCCIPLVCGPNNRCVEP